VAGISASARKIEFLYSDVLDARSVEATIDVHEVRSDDEAERLAFPGSPTIRVDGADVDPAGGEGRPTLSCRVYRLPDGRVSPVPTREQIERALA
jgi:hypothetical protein